MNKINWVKVTAITGLVVLELYALYKGIDGQVLTLVVAGISGLAGYEIAKNKKTQ